MPTYPGAVPIIPEDGTWTWGNVGDEIEAIAGELGVNPSGSQTTVAARFGVVEDRVAVVEAATSIAGVEVAAAEMAADFDIKAQANGATTYTDTGLSIVVPAQTRGYNVVFAGTVLLSTNASFTGPKFSQVMIRIVDAGVTVVAGNTAVPIIMPISGANNYFSVALLSTRVPPNRAATTWKLQTRIAPSALDANVTAAAIYAGASMPAPVVGLAKVPATLQAITV